jgi:hypothetical protein
VQQLDDKKPAHGCLCSVKAKRIVAISDLERFGPEEPGVALAALCDSLGDADARVRAAGAMGLVMVVRSTGLRGTNHGAARRAVDALFKSPKDQR